MRHRNGLRKLNRTSEHRQAMLRNMCNSLLTHEAIKTTLPKAKELRRVAEPLITLAKVDGVANRRLAFSRLRDKEAVGTLFTTLGPRYQSRSSSYCLFEACAATADSASTDATAANLNGQVSNIAEVTTAVAKGDLSRRSRSTCAARSWS